MNLLIVDDKRSLCQSLGAILTHSGHQVQTAASGEEALEKFEAQHFECVLSDIRMPGMNGVELSRAIRKRQPGTVVILMTAYTTDSLIAEGIDEGALMVLNKPLDIDKLIFQLSLLERGSASRLN